MDTLNIATVTKILANHGTSWEIVKKDAAALRDRLAVELSAYMDSPVPVPRVLVSRYLGY